MGKVNGKVAFISGLARGQGRAHALRLAREGADIAGFDVLEDNPSASYPLATQDDLDQTVHLVEKTGRRCLAYRADARDRAAVDDVVARVLADLGHVDIVIANAGIASKGMPYWEIPPDMWRDIVDVDLTGVWNTVSAVTPAMIEAGNGGSMILTASGAGIKSAPNIAAYNSAKHGVVGLMKTMALDVAPYRIRVNALCPSTVATPMIMNERLYRLFRPDLDAPTVEDALPALEEMHLIQAPWVEADDISSFVLWLASDESWFVTGVTMPLDLGLNIKW